MSGWARPWGWDVLIWSSVSSCGRFSDDLFHLPDPPLSDDGGEVELLPLVPRSRSPIVLRGHWGGANQRYAAEEDRPVDLGEGKTPEHFWNIALKYDFWVKVSLPEWKKHSVFSCTSLPPPRSTWLWCDTMKGVVSVRGMSSGIRSQPCSTWKQLPCAENWRPSSPSDSATCSCLITCFQRWKWRCAALCSHLLLNRFTLFLSVSFFNCNVLCRIMREIEWKASSICCRLLKLETGLPWS